VHKAFPGQTKADVGTPGARETPTVFSDNTKSIKELGLTYHTKEQTFHDTVTQLIKLEKEGK
jgi:hypothetical protein